MEEEFPGQRTMKEDIWFEVAKGAALITIADDDGRKLLQLWLEDGRLRAKYDPQDLDLAARRFVEAITYAP